MWILGVEVFELVLLLPSFVLTVALVEVLDSSQGWESSAMVRIRIN